MPRSDFTALSLILSKEVCEAHIISPLLIPDPPENFLMACCPRFCRQESIFVMDWKVPKNAKSLRPFGSRPGIIWVVYSNFLLFCATSRCHPSATALHSPHCYCITLSTPPHPPQMKCMVCGRMTEASNKRVRPHPPLCFSPRMCLRSAPGGLTLHPPVH